MSDDSLLERLREATNLVAPFDGKRDAFTPEAVARGLEAMRQAHGCGCAMSTIAKGWPLVPECDACWANMLDAFLGVPDADR